CRRSARGSSSDLIRKVARQQGFLSVHHWSHRCSLFAVSCRHVPASPSAVSLVPVLFGLRHPPAIIRGVRAVVIDLVEREVTLNSVLQCPTSKRIVVVPPFVADRDSSIPVVLGVLAVTEAAMPHP